MGVIQPCCFDDQKKNFGKRKGGLTRLTRSTLKKNTKISNDSSSPHKYNSKVGIDDIKDTESMNSNNNKKNNTTNTSNNRIDSENDSGLFSEIIIKKHKKKSNKNKNNGNSAKVYNISQQEKSNNSKKICDDFIKGELKGSGRFGKVYTGLGTSSGDMVAIKTFENLNDDVKKNIIKNIDNLCDLKHENILKINTVINDQSKNELSIVYESCNYQSIEEIIKKFGNLDEKIIQKYFKQLLQGLQYLHNKKIIHKNLKSSNIFIDPQGVIKITDCLIDSIILGTKQNIYDFEIKNDTNINYYIPPLFVQNIDDNEIGKEYDFWCLGCLIIEVSSRKKPWSHYNFKNTSEFFKFLKETHLIPTIPKKLSVQCQELIKLLFNPEKNKQNNIYDILFNLDFFKLNTQNFTYQNANKNFNEKSIQINSNNSENFSDNDDCSLNNININININNSYQLGQVLANNKVINLLNNNNNANYSISLSAEQNSSVNSSIYNNNSNNSSISRGFYDFKNSANNNMRNKRSKQTDMSEVIEAKIEQSPGVMTDESNTKFSYGPNKNEFNILGYNIENEDQKEDEKSNSDDEENYLGNRYIM